MRCLKYDNKHKFFINKSNLKVETGLDKHFPSLRVIRISGMCVCVFFCFFFLTPNFTVVVSFVSFVISVVYKTV